MDTSTHQIAGLFEQLGLPSTTQEIDQFISKNSGLAAELPLWQAPFWSNAQAGFLKEAIEEDSDWAEIVDQLDAQLRD